LFSFLHLTGLDQPIKSIKMEGRRFIANFLNDKDSFGEIFTLKGKEVLVLCSGGIEREETGNSCEPLVLRSQFFFWYFAKKESFRI